MTVPRTAIEPSRPGDPPPSSLELVEIIVAARDELLRIDTHRKSRALIVALAALARIAERGAEIERDLAGMSLQ